MKGKVLGLLLLPLLLTATSEVKSEGNPVRLCGRDFIRAVVFTCGGSRWRRQDLTDYSGGFLGSRPRLPLDVGDSTDDKETKIQEPESEGKDFIQIRSQSETDRWGKQEKYIDKRQEEAMQLPVTCCTIGCSESSIRSLC